MSEKIHFGLVNDILESSIKKYLTKRIFMTNETNEEKIAEAFLNIDKEYQKLETK